MATKIWNESYVNMISMDQSEYMLEKYLSPGSIMGQISEGTVYQFITQREKDAGFIAYKINEKELFLSKFYIRKEYRHTGLATFSLRHIKKIAEGVGLRRIYLTVNRKNAEAISAYGHWGFVSVEDVDTDIGNGFFMNDHVMELDIKEHNDGI